MQDRECKDMVNTASLEVKIKKSFAKIHRLKKTEPVFFVFTFLVVCFLFLLDIHSLYTWFNTKREPLHTSIIFSQSEASEKTDKPIIKKIKSATQATEKTETTENEKNTSEHRVLPVGMQKMSAFEHTSEIGTIAHPTLDGGIINAADGVPVYHPAVETVIEGHQNGENGKEGKNKEKNENKENERSGTSIIQTARDKSFSDSWVTSARIKIILEKAALSGKLNYVLSQSDQKHMPASVALLPIVESAYQDNAVSSKGAVGSWQLMSETAKENGISPQERTEFIPSTGAALNYLDQLHKKFGNWTLAFAAYNAGEGRVTQALIENPKASSIEQLNLPQETKNYVNTLINIDQTLLQNEQNTNNTKNEIYQKTF